MPPPQTLRFSYRLAVQLKVMGSKTHVEPMNLILGLRLGIVVAAVQFIMNNLFL